MTRRSNRYHGFSVDDRAKLIESIESAHRLGIADRPRVRKQIRRANSFKLGRGKYARRAQKKLEFLVLNADFSKAIQTKISPQMPYVKEDERIYFGEDFKTDETVYAGCQHFIQNFFCTGPTRYGKTNLAFLLFLQFFEKGIQCVFEDFKGDIRHILHLVPLDKIIIQRPDQSSVNYNEPLSPNNEGFWGNIYQEINKAENPHAQFWVKMPCILQRIQAGIKSNDYFPSFCDIAKILQHLIRHENRRDLESGLRALESFNAKLGDATRVRHGPEPEDRFPVVVYDYIQQPSRFTRCLFAIRLNRQHVKANVTGRHSGRLVRMRFIDEGHFQVGKEQSGVSGKASRLDDMSESGF